MRERKKPYASTAPQTPTLVMFSDFTFGSVWWIDVHNPIFIGENKEEHYWIQWEPDQTFVAKLKAVEYFKGAKIFDESGITITAHYPADYIVPVLTSWGLSGYQVHTDMNGSRTTQTRLEKELLKKIEELRDERKRNSNTIGYLRNKLATAEGRIAEYIRKYGELRKGFVESSGEKPGYFPTQSAEGDEGGN